MLGNSNNILILEKIILWYFFPGGVTWHKQISFVAALIYTQEDNNSEALVARHKCYN